MFAYGTTQNGVAKLKVFTTTLLKQFRANYADDPATTKRLTTNHGPKKIENIAISRPSVEVGLSPGQSGLS